MRVSKGQRGFTLIELMVVIAILGILLGIAAYSFRDTRLRTAVKEGARTFESDVVKARATARTSSEEISVNFVAGSDVYTIVRVRGGRQLLAGKLSRDVVFKSGTAFSFNSKGEINAVQVITLERRDAASTGIADQYRITISITGLTQVDRSLDGLNWSKAW